MSGCLVVANAAGGVNPETSPGVLMLNTGHLNLIGMAWQNPLRGPNIKEFGPHFPDMSRIYDREIADLAHKISKENVRKIQEGVHACLAGPNYETSADLRFIWSVGVDVVGISTVPDAFDAHQSGMRV